MYLYVKLNSRLPKIILVFTASLFSFFFFFFFFFLISSIEIVQISCTRYIELKAYNVKAFSLNSSLTPYLAVIVKIWGGQNDNFNLIIEWEVHLPSLQYLGDQVILTVVNGAQQKLCCPIHVATCSGMTCQASIFLSQLAQWSSAVGSSFLMIHLN